MPFRRVVATTVNLLRWDIKWEIHKRTRQGASSQLVSYLYKNSWSVLPIINPALMFMLHSHFLPHILLKATMCTPCALTSSSRPFHHVLGLWHHIMWPVMWLHCHVPLHRSLRKRKSKRKSKVKLKNKIK